MKKLLYILLPLILLLSMTIPAYANAAEPPGMIVLCDDLPEDAKLTMETEDGMQVDLRHVRRNNIAWESQYRLWFPVDFDDWQHAVLRVTAGESSFTVPLPDGTVMGYNTVLTLDYEKQTLTLGQNFWRQPLLTFLRITLTLLAEGLVFFLFGFREKRSWILFLALNLLTQGCLNTLINSNAFSSGYWMLMFYFMEFCIFLGETVALCLLMKEHKRWKRVICTLLANAVSLAAGILLISNLPI